VGQDQDAEFWDVDWLVAVALTGFFELRCHWQDWQVTHELALSAARRACDPYGEVQALTKLGGIYELQGRLADALTCAQQSIQILGELGVTREEPSGDTDRPAAVQVHQGGSIGVCWREAMQLLDRLQAGNATSAWPVPEQR
jgi:hypothetical protein